jgi:hypothetical protein
MFDVWGEADSFEGMLEAVAAHPAHLKAPHLTPDASFKLILSTVGFKWREEQYKQYVHRAVEAIGFEGEIQLKDPQNTFWVVTVQSDGEAGMPPMPTRWVFGRQVALGDRWVCQAGAGGGEEGRREGSLGPGCSMYADQVSGVCPQSGGGYWI